MAEPETENKNADHLIGILFPEKTTLRLEAE